ncbi:alpha-ribazole phosphatase [Perkinsela sp. CCAP 1560/4]|nr:alpha-ribazole phosphatase [Perkinsela sp. CCAP 1560/4]|eukprot:KNH04833.1 alpha-ribazole phosphatase [Perkinsela sp. CCAP 1560/4]
MSFSYFDPYYVLLERQKVQVELETSIFQGNLLHQTCIFVETPRHSNSYQPGLEETAQKGISPETDDLVFSQTTDLDKNLHALEGTKLEVPMWLAKALIIPSVEDIAEYDALTGPSQHPSVDADPGMSPHFPRRNELSFARILAGLSYQTSYLHRLATPVYSTKHMMYEFASSSLNREVDDYFYDIGMCIAGLLKLASEGERLGNDLYRVYQNRYYFILRGACSGMPISQVRCRREKRLAIGMKAGDS